MTDKKVKTTDEDFQIKTMKNLDLSLNKKAEKKKPFLPLETRNTARILIGFE